MKGFKNLLLAAFALLVALPADGYRMRGVNIVFVGNSVTFGATIKDRTQTAPEGVRRLLEARGTVGKVQVANVGVSGASTADWLPTGKLLGKAFEAGDRFAAEKDVPLFFVVTLGTNDSAQDFVVGSPATKERFRSNMNAIIGALHERYPAAQIVLNHPLWYSANTYNSARYLGAGQRLLSSYREVITDIVYEDYRNKDQKYVHLGDTEGWDLFKENAERLYTAEAGKAGPFYLHPNAVGAQELAKLWERHIYDIWRYMSPDEVTLAHGAKALLYRAEEPSGKAIVVCPGGGYVFLASEHEGSQFAHFYANHGVSALVLLYNFPQGNPETPMNDVRDAITLLRDSAASWGHEEIGIMGSSAGGHLAATAATGLKGELDFQVLLYPVITMEDGVTHAGSCESLLGAGASDDLRREYSNELRVTEETPRAIILFSLNDDIVPAANSLRYAQAMVDKGCSVSLHGYPTGGHGWGFADGFAFRKQWEVELLRWLELDGGEKK